MRIVKADDLKRVISEMHIHGESVFLEARSVEDLIDGMPTIDPESLRPTAKWEKSFYENHEEGKFIVCTRCRHAFSRKGLWCRKYCPECGARMVNADE